MPVHNLSSLAPVKRVLILALGAGLLLTACSSETKSPVAEAGSTAEPDSLRPTAPAAPLSADAPYWQRALADPALKPEEQLKTAGLDFSWVWVSQDDEPLGFIGDTYERLRVRLTSVEPDTAQSNVYPVTGRTKVRNTICPFTGTIRVRHVREFREPLPAGEDGGEPIPRGVVVAECEFREAKKGPHTGVFTGMLTTYWECPPQEMKARPTEQLTAPDEGDDGHDVIDFAFEGEWRSYDGKLRNRVRWGKGAIPDAGALNVGAADFMPAPEYEKHGWKSYADAMRATDDKAWEKERAEW